MNRSNSSPIVPPPKFSSSQISILRRRGGLLVKAGEGPLVGLEVGGVDVEPGDGALPLEGQALLRGEAAGHLRAGVGIAADAGSLGISGGLAGLPNLGGVGDILLEHRSGVGNGGDGSKSSGGSGTEEGAARVGFGVEGRSGGLGNLSGSNVVFGYPSYPPQAIAKGSEKGCFLSAANFLSMFPEIFCVLNINPLVRSMTC